MNVLLIEDNPGDARLIREMLAGAGGLPVHLEHADRLSKGLECLRSNSIDVVLLDLSLPDSQGLDTFVKAQAACLDAPVIVLSGLTDESVAVKAVQQGAQDYLIKGRVDGELLVRAIRYAIERKRLDKIKDQFISSVSHDLRTPLHAMKGFLDLFLVGAYGKLAAEQVEGIQILARANEEMTALVNALLDLSRLNSGRFFLSIEPLDLREIVDEVLEEVKPLAKAKGLTLAKQFGQDSFPMKTDKKSLRQILYNLVGNAIKFTDHGDVRVSVDSVAADPEPLIEIRVRDTGCGIGARDLEKIFDEFYQVDGSGENTTPGTGLGLAICKRLVRLLKGELSAESQPEKGSTFSVKLPQRLP